MSTEKSQRTKGPRGVARLFRGASRGSCIPPASGRPAFWILCKMVAALLVLLVVGASARGQATTSVRGTVADPSGKAVVGASVELTNSESKTERTATTGD